MKNQYILAIDQGTSGTKAFIFDSSGQMVTGVTIGLKSYFPKPGFVEQDPEEIYQSVLTSVKSCLKDFNGRIDACGISNQRETFLLWDASGKPLCNAIVWQCKRSVDICERLRRSDLELEVRAKTGLIIDPYFSATKLIWLYENNNTVRKAIDSGEAFFGTIDSWLLFKLTKNYYTDYTNASRTMFYNIHNLEWDNSLLNHFNLDSIQLPDVKPSAFTYGETDFDGIIPYQAPITAMIGDSHAAAVGEGCFTPGSAKATLGTGCSILMNTGKQKIESECGMMTTICWSGGERVDYAMEGIIVTCGGTIKWLEEQIELFPDSRMTEEMAMSVSDNNGVYFIPAFSGMGAPYWKMDLKAAIVGMTFGVNKNHIVRAALESIPFQIKDVISAMEEDSGIKLKELKVDGGIAENRFIMQFLADLLKTDVVNIGFKDVSALGAACLAGLEVGIYKSISDFSYPVIDRETFKARGNAAELAEYYKGWKSALGVVLR